MLGNVTHEELVVTKKEHTTKSHSHTTQKTCLSSHLLVGLGLFPHILLLVERQMETHEMMGPLKPYIGATVSHINMTTSTVCAQTRNTHTPTDPHANILLCWDTEYCG